ncbi:ATP/GTP-binding protein [Flavobacterium sp.]|uniref:AAA family ATPase n=1 Tax=Flavobacterium sp. TaxID=239 RepID=UPI003750E422
MKHIKSITIENFKCFDYLFVDNFSKYNVILGENNIGKSSFLEVLLFEENSAQTIHNFQSIVHFRKVFPDTITVSKTNPFLFFVNKFSDLNTIKIKKETFNNTFFNAEYESVRVDGLSSFDKLNFNVFFNTNTIEKEILKIKKDDKIEYRRYWNAQNFEQYDTFLPFVYSTAYYDNDLIRFYSNNFTDNREDKKELISQLSFLIPELVDIEVTLINNKNAVVGFWVSNNYKESLIPLAFFGDGTVRFFRLIMEIVMCSNQYLCIDEIDTGIHYSKFKDFSKVVISTANKNNVQLFITTHNNEFLKAFKEVLEEEDFKKYQNETKCFSLKKLPKGDIKAYSYNFDEFEFAIEQENELR